MINCRRPSNKSSRLSLPFGPSNSYFFATAIHGIRRRSAASASRERVKAFSFPSSCWRAASHSCADTIGGALFGRCPFGFSMSLFVPGAIVFLLCFLKQTSGQVVSRYRRPSSLFDRIVTWHRFLRMRLSACRSSSPSRAPTLCAPAGKPRDIVSPGVIEVVIQEDRWQQAQYEGRE